MNPKIHPKFWTDSALEEKPPEMKLTVLWMMTNPQVNLAGVFPVAPRRFAFETGLEAAWLQRTLADLAKMFVVCGESALLKNFIRHQFGSGEKLRANNMGKALMSLVPGLPEPMRETIYALHPELKPLQGLPSPRQALHPATPAPLSPQSESSSTTGELGSPLKPFEGQRNKHKHRNRRKGECEGDSVASGHLPEAEGIPALAEVIAYGNGAPGVPAEFCEHYHTYRTNHRTWFNGRGELLDWQGDLRSWWKNDRHTWKSKKPDGPAEADTNELARLEAELEAETNPDKRRNLRERIEKLNH